MNKRRVVITGMGALSALGATTQELWNGLLANRSGVRRVPRLVESGITVTTGGEVEASHHKTSIAITRLPIARLKMHSPSRIAMLLNAGSFGPPGSTLFKWDRMVSCIDPRGFAFRICHRDFTGPRRMIAAACASGTQAIGEAFRLIQNGQVDACVAGGSSVMLTPFYLIGFAGLQAVAVDNGDDPSLACRPFDKRRKGFALADGAGAMVLETLASARKRAAPIFAEVIGFGMSQDAFDLNRPCDDGAGAELCMRRALEDAAIDFRTDRCRQRARNGDLFRRSRGSVALRKVFANRWQRFRCRDQKVRSDTRWPPQECLKRSSLHRRAPPGSCRRR